MDKLEIHRSSALDWKPSPVVALATSLDGSKVAAVREDSSMELWLVSPGSVGWHCQLRIIGSSSGRVSSLVWCKDRLFSASIDGSVSQWDMFSLKQKVILNTVGVSIWQMAVEPSDHHPLSDKTKTHGMTTGHATNDEYSDCESSDSDEDDEDSNTTSSTNNLRLAVACDDGCIRIYTVTDTDGLIYHRSFPRVNGRALSVVWSIDAEFLFSGSSNGIIRCWDTRSYQEKYRITVGFGGLGSGSELCVWSLLFLRSGTLVSGDSTGSVHFWDSQLGTQIQAQTYHKGDVNALATDPSHTRIFSAGSDGQVILYKMSDSSGSGGEYSRESAKKWIYVGYKRVHSHDIRALTVAVPIISADELPEEKVHKVRRKAKPVDYAYHKWAHLGVPMLISAGDDAKLFAYPTKEFTQFEPHDISPAPQRVSMQLVHNTAIDGASMMLTQHPEQLNLAIIGLNSSASQKIKIKEMAKIKSKVSRKVICSAISSNGLLFAYSDHVKPRLFELKRQQTGSSGWSINELQLPKNLRFPHCMVFSADSSHLMLAGHDRKICVVDLMKSKLAHTFVPQRKEGDVSDANCEPPITKMMTSSDGQWLAAINCFGDIYIFNLEINRQHWFISRLNGASVTAGGFSPKNSNVLVITTSANQIYVFDVDAKQLGEWSRRHTPHLPRRFQEFPGEVIGLSFSPSINSTTVIVYSSRAMCLIDFGMPVGPDEYIELPNGSNLSLEEYDSPTKLKSMLKRKINEQESKGLAKMNFDFRAFNNPTLFVGYISESSLLIIEKPWMQVLKSLDAPVHRQIYGT